MSGAGQSFVDVYQSVDAWAQLHQPGFHATCCYNKVNIWSKRDV